MVVVIELLFGAGDAFLGGTKVDVALFVFIVCHNIDSFQIFIDLKSVQSRKIRHKQKRRQGETQYSRWSVESRTAVLRSGGLFMCYLGCFRLELLDFESAIGVSGDTSYVALVGNYYFLAI